MVVVRKQQNPELMEKLKMKPCKELICDLYLIGGLENNLIE